MKQTNDIVLEQIAFQRNQLKEEMERAVFKMEHNERVKQILVELKELQNDCPHDFQNGKCVACGKKQ